jgi:endonuclease/exonuclease/phosphatase family metal-dependent hydrolase
MKIATWNIQSARSPDGGADIDRVVAMLARFQDADIVCLQEVADGFPNHDGSARINQFAALAMRLPGYHPRSAFALDLAAPDGRRRRLGCLTLSRFPVRQTLRHSLPWPSDPGVPSMPRIALELTLDTPQGLLRVVNTHLEYFSETQRLAQAEHLRILHREACAHASAPRAGLDANGPFAAIPRARDAVLVGDFNMLPGSAAWHALQQAFDDPATEAWHDAWQLAHPAQAHAPTVGLRTTAPFTFDYAFVSTGLAPRVRGVHVDGIETGSDHQPLVLELDA